MHQMLSTVLRDGSLPAGQCADTHITTLAPDSQNPAVEID
jgi:hypothetical protein